MKIWKLTSDDKSRRLSCKLTTEEAHGHPLFSGFDGSKKSAMWNPLRVYTSRKGKYNDFPALLSGTVVLSIAAFEKIGSIIEPQVEYLPLVHDEMNYWLVNVTNVIDCANKDKSIPKTLSSGEVIGLKKVVFHDEKIPADTLIFKIPENGIEIYVTDQFVDLVKQHKLKGLIFKEEWDSEYTEEMEQEKQRKYRETLEAIEKNKGAEFSYEDAVEKVKSGQAVASGKWKMQLDEKGRFWLGQLGEDAKYHWLMPAFIPPVLLGYLWHEVNKSEI